MNKILLPLLTLAIFFGGCENKTVSIELGEQPAVISNLEFEISGKIDELEQDYLFYTWFFV